MTAEPPEGRAEGQVGRGARCPTCGKPSVEAYRPFCSKRCADVDLQRWLTGRYAIPVADDEASSETAEDEDGSGQAPRG